MPFSKKLVFLFKFLRKEIVSWEFSMNRHSPPPGKNAHLFLIPHRKTLRSWGRVE
jgi:hypothetical protein